MFAQTDTLKFKGFKGHGTMCGALLTIVLLILVAAYMADEFLMKATEFNSHSASFRVIDYEPRDSKLSLVDNHNDFIFGIYDDFANEYITIDQSYFQVAVFQQDSKLLGKEQVVDGKRLELTKCSVEQE